MAYSLEYWRWRRTSAMFLEVGAKWRICLRSPITSWEMIVPDRSSTRWLSNDRVHLCAQVRSCSSVGVYEFVCKSSILDRSLFLPSPSSDRSLVELRSFRTKDVDAISHEGCRNVRFLTRFESLRTSYNFKKVNASQWFFSL